MQSVNTKDWNSLGAAYAALEAEPLTLENVQHWLARWSELRARFEEDFGSAMNRANENTADEEAERLQLHYLREIRPQVTIAEEKLKAKLLALPGYEPSADQRVMMQHFETEQRLFREENVPLQTELSVLQSEYRKIAGKMTIEWEGKSLTLPQAELLLRDRDREKREAAWDAIHTRWLEDRQNFNELYLKMIALRRQVARNADFNNYREYAWLDRGRYTYTPEDAITFHESIEKEVVPLARKLYEQRREQLGLSSLRPWDLDVEPGGRPPLEPFQTAEELEEGCARIFYAVDPELGKQFDLLRDSCLDLDSRPNKAPGGYCRSMPVSQRSYIFMNAVGSHRNVQTLLHEGGHAFHNQHAFALPLIWMRHPGAEMAEVASMAMELLCQPYLEQEHGGFYSREDADRARAEHLEKIVLFLPYMAVVDAFQHWVYADAPEGVTAEELDRKWGELWDRFMPGIDYEGLEAVKQSGWHRKLHIFLYPFYYIEYGLAQVGALQVWRNALEDQAAAVADYRRALALGATRPLPELFQAAGARFAVDAEMLHSLMALIESKLNDLR